MGSGVELLKPLRLIGDPKVAPGYECESFIHEYVSVSFRIFILCIPSVNLNRFVYMVSTLGCLTIVVFHFFVINLLNCTSSASGIRNGSRYAGTQSCEYPLTDIYFLSARMLIAVK